MSRKKSPAVDVDLLYTVNQALDYAKMVLDGLPRGKRRDCAQAVISRLEKIRARVEEQDES